VANVRIGGRPGFQGDPGRYVLQTGHEMDAFGGESP
jgi:hypothetical protein